MEKIKIILFICLYCFSLSLNDNEYESDITEGIYKFEIKNNTFYNFTFKAKENGTYFIFFPDYFKLMEATGEMNEDINIEAGFFSTVYAQKFVKDDHIKVEYPRLKYINETKTIKIRIEKIDANFRLMTSINPIILTMAVNDCQKPTYIFTYNNEPESPESYYTFHGKIHSGEFTASYRNKEFNPDDPDESMDKDFTEITISSATSLPHELSLNIIKLKCTKPGIISIYMQKGNFYSIIDDIGFSLINGNINEEVSFSNLDLPVNLYFQGFNLVGKTSINLTEIKGEVYEKDFVANITLSEDSKNNSYNVSIKNNDALSMPLTIFNVGECPYKILNKNQKISVGYNNRIIIPLEKNDSSFIEINSTSGKFYWDYQYSQTSDVNYLPQLSYNSINFQKDKSILIDNPYKYNNSKTDYYWFITLVHFNNEEVSFNYEYKKESDNNNEEKDQNNKKITYTYAWIIILIILILLVIVLVYSCFRSKKNQEISNNIEKLI